MDHSLHSYLKRRSNQELENILIMLQASARDDYEEQIVDMVTKILESRKRSVSDKGDGK